MGLEQLAKGIGVVDNMTQEYQYIVLDVETTGLNPACGTSFCQGGIKERQANGGFDEILQLAIVGQDGQTLFYDSFKPRHKKQWPDAQRVHGITPNSVQDRQAFSEHRAEIQRIIDATGFVVAYNAAFDLKFLQAQGINLKRKPTVCVMQEFAPIFGKRRKNGKAYQWQPLEVCLRYYGIKNLQAHDALSDVRATLCCFQAMLANGQAIRQQTWK